jgi:hypothetical protein
MTDEDPFPSTSSGGGGGGSSRRTRSGKGFGVSDVVQQDEEEEEDLVMGMMRQGGEFQRVTRGHYPTLAMLRQVHHQLFSSRSSFVMIGELSFQIVTTFLYYMLRLFCTTCYELHGWR